MTLQQIEYAIALEKHGSFTKAAESCYVTQPTLTMQIRKLEQELDVEIFDRTSSPITLTHEGSLFMDRARNIVAEVRELYIDLSTSSNLLEGEFNVGIIPTVAPYLVPLFLTEIQEKYPTTRLNIMELQTHQVVEALQDDDIHFGIASTPLNEKDIEEHKLYEEDFVFYTSERSKYGKEISMQDVDTGNLLILDEGHCFRDQILTICHQRDLLGTNFTFDYLAGSIEGLVNLVNSGIGETLVPQLAVNNLSEDALSEKVVRFSNPQPAREISLLTHRRNNYTRLTNLLKDTIINNLGEDVKAGKLSRKIIKWR